MLTQWQHGLESPDLGHGALAIFAQSVVAVGAARAKVQIAGPAIVMGCLGIEAHEAVARCLAYADALAKALPVQVVVQWDEPALGGASGEQLAALARCVEATRASGRETWVHCCGALDWEQVRAVQPDCWSVDPWLTAPPPYRIARIALGVVPTDNSASVSDCVVHGRRWLADAGVTRVVLTPACGLGLRTEALADSVLRTLKDVAAHFGDEPAS